MPHCRASKAAAPDFERCACYLIPAPSYRKFELGTFIEYGATDWLTIVATPSFDRIQQTPSPGVTQTTTGIGDTAIGPRLKIFQSPNLVLSVQGLLRPPLGLQFNSANESYDHSRIWTGELRGLIGYSSQIRGYDYFADFEAGYRWNDMTTPNEWRSDLTLGVHATPVFLVLMTGAGQQTRVITGTKAKSAAFMLSMQLGLDSLAHLQRSSGAMLAARSAPWRPCGINFKNHCKIK
jgi:hypothetical protein